MQSREMVMAESQILESARIDCSTEEEAGRRVLEGHLINITGTNRYYKAGANQSLSWN